MMKNTSLALMGGLALAGVILPGCSDPQPAPPQPANPAAAVEQPAERRVPPYHKSVEAAKPFPTLLPASYFPNHPLVARAYRIAAKIPEVISQQPCYCYCDQHGHGSLLDCYASDHGAG